LNDRFLAYLDRMPVLLQRLTSAPALGRLELNAIPQRGVYALYEGETPIFVGRSDHLQRYLMGQGRAGANANSAPVAFSLAKRQATEDGYLFPTNAAALLHPDFQRLFAAAKSRVAAMTSRVVEVKDPVEQALLVLYAALELNTLNEFETH
jgi:hypothetical protein